MRLQDPQRVAEELKAGRLGILSTDTVPGFHAVADASGAIERIRGLKGRDRNRPLLMLCPDIETALSLVPDPGPRARAYARRCWPGPFTLIFEAGDRLPEAMVSPRGKVAFRVPDHRWLADILGRVGAPLASTSVNRADEPPAATLDEAEAAFGTRVDFSAGAPDGSPRDGTAATTPSAVLDLTRWPPVEIRSGPRSSPAWDDL